MTAVLCLAAAAPAAAAPAAGCAPVVATAAPASPAEMLARARLGGPFPNFCSIPPVPKDIPTAAAYKSQVVDVRLDGRLLERQTAPSTFSLGDTDAFSAAVRGEAAPPPPITTPDEGDTAAFVKAMRAKATPPKRGH